MAKNYTPKNQIIDGNRSYQALAAVNDASLMTILGFAFFGQGRGSHQTYVSDPEQVVSDYFHSQYGVHPSKVKELTSNNRDRRHFFVRNDGSGIFAIVKTNRRATKVLNLEKLQA
jgi:hypothetical protein